MGASLGMGLLSSSVNSSTGKVVQVPALRPAGIVAPRRKCDPSAPAARQFSRHFPHRSFSLVPISVLGFLVNVSVASGDGGLM